MVKSWFCGKCEDCTFEVVVTQPNIISNPTDDYLWYCSNKLCNNHKGEHSGDMECPSWVNNKVEKVSVS